MDSLSLFIFATSLKSVDSYECDIVQRYLRSFSHLQQ